ncbi:flagellar hook-length control protein FliK [Xanthomonas melonis]|uniref:flagellar hook-length control protein FliK n=1 Tax=Xanthomonas melonis TaxID=56456 RepID=UPI003EBD6625
MNPLSAFAAGLGALAGTGKKSSYHDPASEQDPAKDQFARMLHPANTPQQAPERVPAKQAAPKPGQSDKPRSDDDHGDDATGDATARPRAQDGDAKPAASAKEPAAKDSGTASTTGKTATASGDGKDGKDAAADTATATEAAWPPAGLGGFGMSLLAQAVPGGDALAAAAAALAASVANAAGTTPTATAQPTDAAAAPATAAVTTTALPSLGALAPAAATTAKPTSSTAVSGDAQTVALMSMAAKALAPADDDGASPAGPDAPAFVLPTAAASTPTRVQDPAPIFSASPTPTPEMGSDTFDDAIGARLSWLADQKIGHAHIKLSPSEMGPVEVRLHLEGDKVNASFTATNADTRQALEQSLPRLRDMLGQNGFQLGQADVSQQQHGQSGNRNGGGSEGNGLTLDDSPAVGIPSVVLRQRGLLDAYA